MPVTAVMLRGARILGRKAADIHIHNGIIVAIGADLPGEAATEVDCAGLVALPGLVDLHTHLRDPGPVETENMRSATAAAARGGFTAVCAMANTDPVADTPEVVIDVYSRAARAGICDVYPVGAVSRGLTGRDLADIPGMAGSPARVRIFSDDGKCVHDAALMRRALIAVKDVEGVLAQHAQDPQLTPGAQAHEGEVSRELGLPGWPPVAEEAIIARDALMAHHLGARLHVCHVSTAGSVEIIRWAKSQGWPVTAEVTPHHLVLTDDLIRTGDTSFKVNPPLRTAADVSALRHALADGTIDAVATDHAPHPVGDKAKPWHQAPMGMLGLETALAVVAEAMVGTGLLNWAGVADRMCTRPARIASIRQWHGRPLQPGAPANLCLLDPGRRWTVEPEQLASQSRNTPFAQHSFSARVVATLLRGQPTYDLDGRFGLAYHPWVCP